MARRLCIQHLAPHESTLNSRQTGPSRNLIHVISEEIAKVIEIRVSMFVQIRWNGSIQSELFSLVIDRLRHKMSNLVLDCKDVLPSFAECI